MISVKFFLLGEKKKKKKKKKKNAVKLPFFDVKFLVLSVIFSDYGVTF